MSVSIGDLRHRLALEAPLATPDGGGGVSRSWTLIAEVWRAIVPADGTEVAAADGMHGRVSHEIWLRYRTGVLPEMRLKLGSRVFEIRSAIDTGERHRFLRCLVEERVA